MTNEELKEKICEIIADNYLPKEMPDRLEDYKLYRFKRAADALIAEGLKFDTVVSHTATFDLAQQEYINSLERRCAQAEHRAARAERALMDMCEEYENYFECDLYKECNSDKPCYLCDYTERLQRAERKLAEEGK